MDGQNRSDDEIGVGRPKRMLCLSKPKKKKTSSQLYKVKSSHDKVSTTTEKNSPGKKRNIDNVTHKYPNDVQGLSCNDDAVNVHKRSREICSAKRKLQSKRRRVCFSSSSSSKADDVEVDVNGDEVGTGECSINILNDDCLKHVFSYLCKAERIKIERVCKRWQMVSKDMWLIQKHLEFSSIRADCPKKMVTMNILKSFLSRCGKNLKTLDVSVKQSNFTAGVSKVIAKYCKNLHSLNLSGLSFTSYSLKYIAPVCGNLRSLSMNGCSGASEKEYESLFNASPHLETVSLAGNLRIRGKCLLSLNRTQVKHLVLDECHGLRQNFVFKALPKLKNLVHLSLNECFEFSKRTLCDDLTEVLPKLQSLSLENSFLMSVKMHQNLVELNLAFSRSADDEVLENIAQNCKRIEKLNISGCCNRAGVLKKVTNIGIKCVASLPHLLELKMSYLPHVTDESLIAIARYCNLHTLVCRGCSKISDEGCSRIITSCSRLKLFDLTGSRKVGVNVVKEALKAVKLRTNDIALHLIVGGTSIEENIQVETHPLLSVDFSDSHIDFYEFDFLNYDESDDSSNDIESDDEFGVALLNFDETDDDSTDDMESDGEFDFLNSEESDDDYYYEESGDEFVEDFLDMVNVEEDYDDMMPPDDDDDDDDDMVLPEEDYDELVNLEDIW